MKKTVWILAAALLTSTLAASNAQALNWVVSPYSSAGGTIAFGKTVVVGAQDANELEYSSQDMSIFGAGFNGGTSIIKFDYDLYTWDSYSASDGWYDVFIVNINQEGYYWDLVEGGSGAISSLTDSLVDSSYTGGTPIFDNSVLPGATWVFGGESWGDRSQDVANNAPGGVTWLGLPGGGDPSRPYYVSLVLDTKTGFYSDTNFSSWGSFHVTPIPEPATMILFGSGLAGLATMRRRKMSKNV